MLLAQVVDVIAGNGADVPFRAVHRPLSERLAELPGVVTQGQVAGTLLFAILNCALDKAIEPLLAEAASRLSDKVEINGCHARTKLAFGAARAEALDQTDADWVLERAQRALRQALQDDTHPVRVYEPSQAQAERTEAALAADLSHAIERNELSLVYQPLIDARLGAVAGVEALMRWHHPVHGPVSPGFFIPLAERTGSIEALTAWLIERAFQDMAPLFARHDSLRLSFNLSGAQVHERGLEALTERLDRQDLLSLDRLTIELTEGVLLSDDEKVGRSLDRLRKRGIRLAIDDFGTGYSSLSYLDRFSFDLLKVDRAFVQNVDQKGVRRRLAEAVIGMGRILGLQIVAEGVETMEQAAFVLAHGCRYIQGFLFGRPLPVEQVGPFIDGFVFPKSSIDALYWSDGGGLPQVLSDHHEQALRLFVDNVPLAVVMIDHEGRCLMASRRWLEDFGLADQNIVGRQLAALVPNYPPLAALPDVADGALERPRQSVDRFQTTDGRTEWVRWEVHPFETGCRAVTGWIMFSELVTDRIEAEQSVRDRTRTLELASQIAKLGYFRVDLVERKIEWSKQVFEVLNLDPASDQPRFDDRAAWCHPDDRSWVKREIEAAEAAARSFDYRARKIEPDGSIGWARVIGECQTNDRGEAIAYFGIIQDVTDFDSARSRLQIYKAMVDALPDLIYAKDEKCRFVMANLATARHMGASSEDELLGLTDYDFHPKDMADIYAKEETNLMASGQPALVEEPFRRKDGSSGRLTSLKVPLLDEDGGVIGLVGHTRDVTELWRAKRAIAEREAENQSYKTILDLLPDTVYRKDFKGRFTYANQATLCQLGVDELGQALGKSDADFFAPQMARRYADDEQAILAQGETKEFVQPCRRPDGGMGTVLAHKSPLFDELGNVVGLIGVNRDITDITSIRHALTSEHAKAVLLRQILEAIPDCITVVNAQGLCTLVNPAAASRAGASCERDIEGLAVEDVLDAGQLADFRKHAEAIHADRQPISHTYYTKDADGRSRWWSSLRMPVTDPEGQIVGVASHDRDITQLKLLEAHLQEEKRRLEHQTVELETQADEMSRLLDQVERSQEAEAKANLLLHTAANEVEAGFAVCDADDYIVFCNQPFAAIYGLSAEDFVGLSFEDSMVMAASAGFNAGADEPSEDWLELRRERHRKADGVPWEFRLGDGVFLVRESRTATGMTVLIRSEITHLKKIEDELRELATVDPLTGLFNRRFFTEKCQRFLARAEGADSIAALILFDIDHFKRVNDEYGHAAGDHALKQASQVLESTLRPTDLVARWGGEEFLILLEGSDEKRARSVAQRLNRAMESLTVDHGGRSFGITASMGIASTETLGFDMDDLLHAADRALYRAKALGRNRCEVSGPDDLNRSMSAA
ncbi:MAG: EAL domain-containing protein [Geminicoccaceae bacterium]